MIKLVAFDWNGTLFADTQTVVKADNKILRSLGLRPVTVRKFRETFDIPIIKYWKSVGLTDALLRKNLYNLYDLFSVYYEPLADKTRSRAGARQVLKFLKSKKIRVVIFSNHTRSDIHRQLVRLKIDQYISTILARPMNDYSIVHFRSKAQKLYDYVKRHKFKSREVITIGDTEEEVEIDKKFGYHTVAITGGYNTVVRLKKHRPDFLIHNLLELKNIIRRLNGGKIG